MKKVLIFAAAIALTLASCGNKSQSNAASTDSTATESTDTTAANAEAGEETIDESALSEDSHATIANLTSQLQKAVAAKDNKAAINTLANMQTIYKNLVAEGKLEEAKAYGASIKNFVNENADAIKNVANGNVTILQLIDGVKNLPTSAAATAEQAKAAVNNDIINLASPVIAKGETAIASAKEAEEALKNAPAAAKAAAENAANQAVSNAKATAETKVNSEVQKVNDKATSAVNSAKAKVAEEKAKSDAAKAKAKQDAANKVNEAKQKANDAVNNAANKTLNELLKR